MKKFFLFIVIIALILLFCLNGQFNAFSRVSFAETPFFIYRGFQRSPICLHKKSTTYTMLGSVNDIALLLDLLSISVVDIQYLDDLIIYYGYSPRFGTCLAYKGTRYNVQIAYSSGAITIASPVIAGSY